MKTAIITGISSGIGQAIAQNLRKNDWNVIGLSRDAKAYAVDLSDLKAVAELGNKLVNEFKTIEAFIHAAGVWHTDKEVLADKNLETFSALQIAETMDVGVTACMVLMAKLLPNMPRHGIVIGVTGTFNNGAGGWLPYYTSKRALEDFLVGLSQDYPHGPKIFGISPADTATPAYKKFYPQYATEAQSPGAIADLILELLHGKTTYKTGDIIEVRNGKMKLGFHI